MPRFNPRTGGFEPDVDAFSALLHGEGAPVENLGRSGSFYIDTEAITIYGPKGVGWGDPQPLRGPRGESSQGLPGERGGQGQSGAVGPTGADGLDGAAGTPGHDGRDGESIQGLQGLRGLDGADAAPLELSRNRTHVQWRLQGEIAWKDLFALPKAVKGGGGVHKHADLYDMPSDDNADHDGRYYTKTEIDALLLVSVKAYRSVSIASTFQTDDYHIEQSTSSLTDSLPPTVESGRVYVYSNVSGASVTLQATGGALIYTTGGNVATLTVQDGETYTVQGRPAGGWKVI